MKTEEQMPLKERLLSVVIGGESAMKFKPAKMRMLVVATLFHFHRDDEEWRSGTIEIPEIKLKAGVGKQPMRARTPAILFSLVGTLDGVDFRLLVSIEIALLSQDTSAIDEMLRLSDLVGGRAELSFVEERAFLATCTVG